MQGIKNLTQGPINRQLFNLAMPIMATSFIQMAYSLTDMAWVGRLGSEAVAAIGSVGILTWMSGSISLLNKVGSEVSVGQSIGAQSQEDARSFASHNITIALIISICWGTLLFIFAEPIIRIYELEDHITANAIQYLRIVSTGLGGFPFFTRLKKKYTRRIFKLGLPVATLNTLFAFVNMFLCRTASEQGGHIGLMTFTTGGQIEAITWNTSQGFSTALSAFIAQNYAAGRVERVLRAWYTTLWMTGIFGTFCTLLFVFFGNEVFAIFVPEQAAYEAGGVFLRIDGYSQLFMMLEITMQGVFYGIGRTIPPAIISISCNYMRIPLAILFVRMGMGVEGIWWAVCVTTVAKGLILLSWFIIIKKKCLSVPSTIKG